MGDVLQVQILDALDDLREEFACVLLVEVALVLQPFEQLAALAVTA